MNDHLYDIPFMKTSRHRCLPSRTICPVPFNGISLHDIKSLVLFVMLYAAGVEHMRTNESRDDSLDILKHTGQHITPSGVHL